MALENLDILLEEENGEHPPVTRFVDPEEEREFRERSGEAGGREEKEEELLEKDLRVEICFPYLRYRLPMNDRQSLLYSKERSEKYTAALLKEIEGSGDEFLDYQVSSIVFRGGAGLEEPKVLGRILRQVKKELCLAQECEISLEANFGEIDMKRLRSLMLAGIHRFVIRAWSFSQSTCRKIGCLYDETLMEQLMTACNTSRKAEVCLTLYYDIPGESKTEFRRTLEYCSHLKLTQIAFLPYDPMPETGKGEEGQKKMERRKRYETFLRGYMKSNGFEEYETMIFARRGKESLDLLMSQNGTEKIGFGMGAETFLDGCRAANLANFDRYLLLAGDYRQLAVPVPDGMLNLAQLTSPEDLRRMLMEITNALKEEEEEEKPEKKDGQGS